MNAHPGSVWTTLTRPQWPGEGNLFLPRHTGPDPATMPLALTRSRGAAAGAGATQNTTRGAARYCKYNPCPFRQHCLFLHHDDGASRVGPGVAGSGAAAMSSKDAESHQQNPPVPCGGGLGDADDDGWSSSSSSSSGSWSDAVPAADSPPRGPGPDTAVPRTPTPHPPPLCVAPYPWPMCLLPPPPPPPPLGTMLPGMLPFPVPMPLPLPCPAFLDENCGLRRGYEHDYGAAAAGTGQDYIGDGAEDADAWAAGAASTTGTAGDDGAAASGDMHVAAAQRTRGEEDTAGKCPRPRCPLGPVDPNTSHHRPAASTERPAPGAGGGAPASCGARLPSVARLLEVAAGAAPRAASARGASPPHAPRSERSASATPSGPAPGDWGGVWSAPEWAHAPCPWPYPPAAGFGAPWCSLPAATPSPLEPPLPLASPASEWARHQRRLYDGTCPPDASPDPRIPAKRPALDGDATVTDLSGATPLSDACNVVPAPVDTFPSTPPTPPARGGTQVRVYSYSYDPYDFVEPVRYIPATV